MGGGFLPTAFVVAFGSSGLSLFSLLWTLLELFAFAALVPVCLRRRALLDLAAFAALVRLCAYGVGLSLHS